MKTWRNFTVVWLCVACVACASLGLAPAKSFDDRLAYAYGSNTALRTAATNSLTAGSISSGDAEEVLKLTDQARALLDAAKLASASGDPQTADGKLLLATNILTQLRVYLGSRGVT